MKRLVTRVYVELVFLETLLSLSWNIIRDSLKDSYNYKISLRKALRLNKTLYQDVFEINFMKKEEGVTERDKTIWIEQKRDQHLEYLEQLGKRQK